MQATPSQSNSRFILIGLTCALFVALITSPVSALPPRPTPVPTLPAASEGAYIQLSVSTTQQPWLRYATILTNPS